MTSYRDKEKAAADKVAEALALPVAEFRDDLGTEDIFDPWEIFPVFYGSYSGAFDDVALTVLRNMRDRTCDGESLPHEMFREYLCRAGVCDYGTSPRVCFPTYDFLPLLPALVDKWEQHSRAQWDDN